MIVKVVKLWVVKKRIDNPTEKDRSETIGNKSVPNRLFRRLGLKEIGLKKYHLNLIMENLPIELQWIIMKFVRHPVADVFHDVVLQAYDREVYLKRWDIKYDLDRKGLILLFFLL